MEQLKAEAERVYNEMQNYTPGSQEYEHLLGEWKQIQVMITEREKNTMQMDLEERKMEHERRLKKSDSIDNAVKCASSVGVTGISLVAQRNLADSIMLFEESGHIFRSKAFGWLVKPKIL